MWSRLLLHRGLGGGAVHLLAPVAAAAAAFAQTSVTETEEDVTKTQAAAEDNKHATAKWRVFTDRARELHLQGRIEEARELFKRAAVEAEKGFGAGDEHIAASYQNLAELLRINREFDQAEDLYLKAIKLLEDKRQSTEGDKDGVDGNESGSKEGSNSLTNQFEGNSFVSAAIREKALATTVDRLCGLYLQMRPRKLEKAKSCYRKALALKISAFGSDHIEVVDTLANAGQVSRLEGDARQAIDLIGQSLECLLRNQGAEGEGGRQMIQSNPLKVFRARSLQLANLLLRQDTAADSRRAEEVMRRLVVLMVQSIQHGEDQHDEDESEGEGGGGGLVSEDEVVGKDLQVCNLLCQSLIYSGSECKCEDALIFLKQAKRHILEVSASATHPGNTQLEILHCAVNRQLAEAYLCVTGQTSSAEKKESFLKEVQALDLEKRQDIVERWWDNLQAKKGVEVLQKKRLLFPASIEFLLYLKVLVQYRKQTQGLSGEMVEGIRRKLDLIRKSSQDMQRSQKDEIKRLIATVDSLFP